MGAVMTLIIKNGLIFRAGITLKTDAGTADDVVVIDPVNFEDGSLSSILISDPGVYTTAPEITVSSPNTGGITASVKVVMKSVAGGLAIDKIVVTNPGTQYSDTNPPVLTITGGNPIRSATVEPVIHTGVDITGITGVAITNPGSGYSAPATVTFSPPDIPGGVTAQGTVIMTGTGSNRTIAGITITNPGTGYLSPPTATITPGTGNNPPSVPATATTTVNQNPTVAQSNTVGSVSSVTITNSGGGYSNTAVVTFNPPPIQGGIPAQGTAVMTGTGSNQSVVGVNVTNSGSGYTDTLPATATISPAAGDTGNITPATTTTNMQSGTGNGSITSTSITNPGSVTGNASITYPPPGPGGIQTTGVITTNPDGSVTNPIITNPGTNNTGTGDPTVSTDGNITTPPTVAKTVQPSASTPLITGDQGYAFTSIPSSIDEGKNYKITIASNPSVPNRTKLYWSLVNVSTETQDFSVRSGAFRISKRSSTASGTGAFYIKATADLLLEGDELFKIVVTQGGLYGPTVLESNLITVNDTSVPTYRISSIPSAINEDDKTKYYSVSTRGVPSNTILYWTIQHNTTSDADFFQSSGTFVINKGSGRVGIIPLADLTTEGSENFTIQVRTGSYAGPVVATTNSLTIRDTSAGAPPPPPPAPTYSWTSAPTSIDEGSTGEYFISTTNVPNGTTLYWTINNIDTANADFNSASGSFSVLGNTGTFAIGPLADLVTEGPQTFTVKIRTVSASGTVVLTSDTVTVNDTSTTPVPTYAFSSQPTSIDEGSTGTFNFSTTNVPNGTTLYWSIVNSNTANADFNAVSGSFSVSGGSGSFTITPKADMLTEGSETFTVRVRTVSASGTVVATSDAVTVNDTSTTQTYSFSSQPTSINEGSTSGTFNVSTTGVANGTTVYWTINHSTTTDADFDPASGSFNIDNQGNGTFTVFPIADSLTEGPQTFTVSVRKDSASGTIVATSATVTVNDTSTAPVPTYAFSSQPSSIDEGSTGTFNVSTTNVSNGTTLYWAIVNGTTANADFSAASGSFSISNNAGSFTVSPTADFVTEGDQTFTVVIKTVSASGTTVATSDTVTVNDTSVSPTYQITAPASINEGASGTFNVSTTGVANGTTLYWTATNVSTTNADLGTLSASFTINNNAGSFSMVPAADLTTEGAETFTVSIRVGGTTGTAVATSSAVTVNDTSTTPAPPTYAFSSQSTSINEGSTGTFNVSTTGVANGTPLYWSITNTTTTNADFSLVNGTFTVSNNAGSFTVGPLADLLTEGAETFTVALRTGSVSGTVVATSSTVTVNDTSTAPVPTYFFNGQPTSINEGTATTFVVGTTNVPNSTTLYWTIVNGTTSNADFSAVSGSFSISSNAGSFAITPLADVTTEGSETFTINIRTGSAAGPVVATSTTVTINDTSAAPTYQIASVANVDEGSALSVAVTTTGVSNGTTLYWTINNASSSNADFNTLSGSFSITSTGTGVFSVTPTADLLTEGSETFTLSVRTGSVSGPIMVTSGQITINDTSTAPAPTYSISGPASINEGSTGTFTVTTTNVVNGTVVYWGIWNTGTNQTINSADFPALTGAVTINNNAGTFQLRPTADSTTEGSEEFTVALSTGADYTGTELARTSTIIINDTSVYTSSSASFNRSSLLSRGSGSNQTYSNVNITAEPGVRYQIVVACLTSGGNGQKSVLNSTIGAATNTTLAGTMNANGGDTQSSIFYGTWDVTSVPNYVANYTHTVSTTVGQQFSGSKDRSGLILVNIPLVTSSPYPSPYFYDFTSGGGGAAGAATSVLGFDVRDGDIVVLVASGYTTTARTFNFNYTGTGGVTQLNRQDQRVGSNQQTVLLLRAMAGGRVNVYCTPSGPMTGGHQTMAAIWRR